MRGYRVIPVSDSEWAVECHEGDETVFTVRGGYASEDEARGRISSLFSQDGAVAFPDEPSASAAIRQSIAGL